MTDAMYELWMSENALADPPEFSLYAMPAGTTQKTLVSPPLTRQEMMTLLGTSERPGLRLSLEFTRGGDHQIDANFTLDELVQLNLSEAQPSAAPHTPAE